MGVLVRDAIHARVSVYNSIDVSQEPWKSNENNHIFECIK